jgi:hypothetical protein
LLHVESFGPNNLKTIDPVGVVALVPSVTVAVSEVPVPWAIDAAETAVVTFAPTGGPAGDDVEKVTVAVPMEILSLVSSAL